MRGADQFEAFVRAHQNLVYATAFRLLGDATEAEDVAQTVFLKAFERFEAIGSSPTASGWLKTVTMNVCLNHLSRYRKRWRLFSEMRRGEGDEMGSDYEEGIPSETGPSREIEREERQRKLEAALAGLPDHQRVPLVLFHFEDKTYDDIAAMLGVSLGKVKTDIHRGRAALRRQLR